MNIVKRLKLRLKGEIPYTTSCKIVLTRFISLLWNYFIFHMYLRLYRYGTKPVRVFQFNIASTIQRPYKARRWLKSKSKTSFKYYVMYTILL